MTTIHFTANGRNLDEINRDVDIKLRDVGATGSWVIDLDVRPTITNGLGEIGWWEADVTATHPLTQRCGHEVLYSPDVHAWIARSLDQAANLGCIVGVPPGSDVDWADIARRITADLGERGWAVMGVS